MTFLELQYIIIIVCYHYDDKLLFPNGYGQAYVTYILNFGAPAISLESVNLWTSNFVCWLILRST